MPGTLVKDNSQVLISNQTLTTTTTGSAVLTGRDNVVRVRLQVTGTVSGTSPTLSVEIQGSDTSDFSTDPAVHCGSFNTVTATLGATGEHFLDVDNSKAYLRAVATVGGTTPSFAGVTVDVVEKRYHRKPNDTA